MNLGFGKETGLKNRVSDNNNPKLEDESGDQAGTGVDSRSPLLKKNEGLNSEPNQWEKDAARLEEGSVDTAMSLQTEGNLTRTQVLSFFKAATNRMSDAEVRILCFFFSASHIDIIFIGRAALRSLNAHCAAGF